MASPVKDKGLTSDILVVDDEADIRALIKGILNDEGLSVREAANADETLKAIAARRPNLVILDIWLAAAPWTACRFCSISAANSRHARHHDQRPRQYRYGGGGHQDGRL